ncbi:Zinc finger MYND domain-containing protein [Dirofilaria immitis]
MMVVEAEGEMHDDHWVLDDRMKRMIMDLQRHWLTDYQQSREKLLVEMTERLHQEFLSDQQKIRTELLTQFKDELDTTRAELEEKYRESLKVELGKMAEKHRKEISNIKKKQWCWQCEAEAIYHCCWNTAYCSFMKKEYMRRITHSDETMVKDRKQGNISNLLKKEIPKPCKAEAIPLKPVNQEICQNPINIKLLKNFGQYLNVSEKENRLVTQDVTQIFHNKPTIVSDDLSHYEFTGDNDLKKTLSHMEEKFTNTSEELQAADEELAELRVALHNAKRMIEILRTENAEQAEKIKFLIKKQKNDQSLEMYSIYPNLEIVQIRQIEISSTEHDSNRNLQKLIEELEEEKMTLNLALENSKTNESKVVLENNRLKEERKEWHQMQKDLLVAVKSWEDKAWRRLMLGCERGSRRNTLLRWCQEAVAKFSLVEITNFSSSWADGKALCCLLASFYPNKLSIDEACILEAEECLELALSVGAHIGVEVRVKVSDFRRKDHPEWSLIMRLKL